MLALKTEEAEAAAVGIEHGQHADVPLVHGGQGLHHAGARRDRDHIALHDIPDTGRHVGDEPGRGVLKVRRTKSMRSLSSPQRAATTLDVPVLRLNSAYPMAEQMASVSGFLWPMTMISLMRDPRIPQQGREFNGAPFRIFSSAAGTDRC